MSLPNLKNIKLNSSLQNYPRPIVIKTKEFNRKSKPDLKIGLKDAKPLNLKEINVDGDKIFPPKEKNENKNNVFWGTRNQFNEQFKDQFKFFLTEGDQERAVGKQFIFWGLDGIWVYEYDW